MNHTPGPWEACRANNCNCKCGLVWSIDKDVVIAHTVHAGSEITEGEGVSLDEAIANARLIAAAPATKQERDELLEACETILGRLLLCEDAGDYGMSDEIALLETVIAKAKGEGTHDRP